ncbi:hypothetical protein [Caulobacter hibisci]|uniref:Uncharacterized protein n=1 Tax=Caulobacter hibisci TaxID=2035993 RepID=A0ABS0SVW7_9CAUL|nr:hypothetical protein [Caulobacter hibisci]MBI1682777.1 hypothetical protein [Caulobacter hibisci]
MASALMISALLAATAPGSSSQEPPPLWSGRAGFVSTTLILPKSGELHQGDVLVKKVARPSRSARLVETYSLGEGLVIPAGAPFFAYFFPVLQGVGSSPLPERRDNDLTWCAAATTPPHACFRWNGVGRVEYSPATDDPIQDRSPLVRGWIAAPEPKLVEEKASIDPGEELMVVKSIEPTGVTVTTIRTQGAIEKSSDRTYFWGQSIWLGDLGTMTLTAVKDAKGKLTGATGSLTPR